MNDNTTNNIIIKENENNPYIINTIQSINIIQSIYTLKGKQVNVPNPFNDVNYIQIFATLEIGGMTALKSYIKNGLKLPLDVETQIADILVNDQNNKLNE